MWARVLKILFFAIIVRPVVFVILGLNIQRRHMLPKSGPAIIAANHNSHLDTMVLMSLYPLRMIHKIRPVAAADYFLSNRWLAWFSLNVIGIIPLRRDGGGSRDSMFDGCHEALDQGHIVILFPEGSRGEPEKMSRVKKGLYHLIGERETLKVTPVVMRGLGRSLPRGEAMLVPFNCDVVVGELLPEYENSNDFVSDLTARYDELLTHCLTSTELD